MREREKVIYEYLYINKKRRGGVVSEIFCVFTIIHKFIEKKHLDKRFRIILKIECMW